MSTVYRTRTQPLQTSIVSPAPQPPPHACRTLQLHTQFAQANSWLIFCHIRRLLGQQKIARQCDNVHKQQPIIIVQAQASVLASSVSERKFILVYSSITRSVNDLSYHISIL